MKGNVSMYEIKLTICILFIWRDAKHVYILNLFSKEERAESVR